MLRSRPRAALPWMLLWSLRGPSDKLLRRRVLALLMFLRRTTARVNRSRKWPAFPTACILTTGPALHSARPINPAAAEQRYEMGCALHIETRYISVPAAYHEITVFITAATVLCRTSSSTKGPVLVGAGAEVRAAERVNSAKDRNGDYLQSHVPDLCQMAQFSKLQAPILELQLRSIFRRLLRHAWLILYCFHPAGIRLIPPKPV